MHQLKNLSLAMLSLSASISFAGTMGPACTPGQATVPCSTSAWDIGIQALYLHPSFAGDPRTLVGLYTTKNVNGTRVWVNRFDDYDWGFKIEGSYHFNTGNDVNLNWYHYDNTFGQPYQSTNFNGAILDIDVNQGVKWDALNLELGQHVDFGENKNVRFHGGIQYANLEATDYSLFRSVIFEGALVVQNSQNRTKQEYSGFGPRFGLDMDYDFKNGVAIYANGAAAVLVGKSQVNDASDEEPNRSEINSYIVPEIEGKVGVKYSHAMAQGTLMADLGYMAVNYFSAIYTTQEALRGSNNFGLSGPYAGLKWTGSV
jgi:hypothetical protein